MDLTRLLRPASVAVVGATDRHGSYGAQALLNLDAIGFAGDVWGVNPGRSEVFGRPCVPSIADLPAAVDAVIVAIPGRRRAGRDRAGGRPWLRWRGCVQRRVRRDRRRRRVCRRRSPRPPGATGCRCAGPTAMGSSRCARASRCGAMRSRRGSRGAVALVSQSGNVAVNALAAQRGLRFHTVIASGNQAVLSAADYLEALAVEDGVGAVALYLEDDGGPRLCEGLAACAERGVRVAVLKVGSSAAGAAAAAAHSGALAGDQRVFRALIEEAGALWAQDVHELLELAKALASRSAVKPPPREGVAILTCSGGDSAQGADEAARLGVPLPAFAPATRARLRELLPETATVANPLDYTTMIWGEAGALAELVQTVGDDPAIDELLVFYDQPRDLDGASEESWAAVREGIIAGAAGTDAQVLVSSTLPELLDDAAAWQVRFARDPGCGRAPGRRPVRGCATDTRRRPRATAGDRGGGRARARRRGRGDRRARRQADARRRGGTRTRRADRRRTRRRLDRAGGARRPGRVEAELGRRHAQVGARRRGAGSPQRTRCPRRLRAARGRPRRRDADRADGAAWRRATRCRASGHDRAGAGGRARRDLDRGPRRRRRSSRCRRTRRGSSTHFARCAAPRC